MGRGPAGRSPVVLSPTPGPEGATADREHHVGGGRVLPVNLLPRRRPTTVDRPRPARAMAIGAHPDDIEFGCGATLAKWAAQGTILCHVVLTDGARGSWDPDQPPAALAACRQEEQRAAADVVAGRRSIVVFLGQPDGELREDPDTTAALVRCIREFQPDVVLGHDPWRRYRLHPDHRHAGFLLTDSIVAARDPLSHRGTGPGPHRPDALMLWEADEPNHVENVAGWTDRKLWALLQHQSQYPSTMGIDPATTLTGTDDPRCATFVSSVRATLAEHGALAGLDLGEAFHVIDDV